MPELPELETIKNHLQLVLTGKMIKSVEVRESKMAIGDTSLLINSLIKQVRRYGKTCVIDIATDSNKIYSVSFHLKLSGQLLFAQSAKTTFPTIIPRANSQILPAKTTRIILYFADDSRLYFNDMRKFGWMKIEEEISKPTAPDVMEINFTPEYLFSVTRNTRRPIKVVLMDQSSMAGIGNIYANDSLWGAKIYPGKSANKLSQQEVKQLYNCILAIIREGIQHKGSSAKDELYILPDGTKGEYQNHFKVYHRTGLPCLRCETKIVRSVVGGRGTFYCPLCQKI